eukprot:3940375-Rhodomonas_salina.4
MHSAAICAARLSFGIDFTLYLARSGYRPTNMLCCVRARKCVVLTSRMVLPETAIGSYRYPPT